MTSPNPSRPPGSHRAPEPPKKRRRRRPFRLSLSIVTVVVTVVTALVVASGWVLVPRLLHLGDQTPDPVPVASATISDTGPGSLVSAMTMPAFTHSPVGSDIRAARVVYRSTNGDSGADTVVSGSVFAPTGDAPTGGWPVVAYGHGTTGLDEPCAPSLSSNLLGVAETIAGLVRKGYAVAFADYQGLGQPGEHPYTDAKTAGLNVIDSVRALRNTYPDVSNRWAAFGGSQGGGATWAADELARGYAPELDLVGVVAMVPAVSVTGLVDKAVAGTMTSEQNAAFVGIVESLARIHPDLNRDDFRRGAAEEYWDVLTACSGPMVSDRGRAIRELTAEDLTPSSPAAADQLRSLLAAWALPKQPLSAPLSVVYGGEDEYIDPQWITTAIADQCALGGDVVWDLQPDKGHGNVDVTAQFSWIADRFAGKPVADECTEKP